MQLTKKIVFLGSLILGLVTIFLVIFDVQYFHLRAIFSFIFLITIPGLLIMLIFKIREAGFWEYLVYTIGLSIAFLMFSGLTIDWILPWLHITDKPLALTSLLICFSIILSIFGIIAYRRNRNLSLKIRFPKLNQSSKALYIIPVAFPLLGILGAITLNNGGPNYLTMIMLGGITAYVFLIILSRNNVNENIYPWAILIISISLILSYSLRSWHVLGWDINQEYLVFTLTNNVKYWSPLAFGNVYNSCLSITILPTVLASFVKINNEYIYKLLFPILFSIVPLTIYLSTKKFLGRKYAFLSSFFFISQSWFIEQMPSLCRQEIAFIFFGTIFLLIFNHKISVSVKYFLSVVFGTSVILSHYSTAYVWLGTLIIFFVLGNLLKITLLKKFKLFFSLRYILLMIIITFLWEFKLNIAPDNFGVVLSDTITDITNVFSRESISSAFDRLTFNNLNINNDQNVYSNYLNTTSEYKYKKLISYPESAYQEYIPRAVFSTNLESLLPINIATGVYNLLRVNKLILIVILPFVGMAYLFIKHFYKRNKNRNINHLYNNNGNYVLISISILPLIALTVLFPLVQTQYNLTRIYMQGLLSFSFLSLVGGSYLLYKLKLDKMRSLISGLALTLFFLSSTGLIYQLTGGSPTLLLNNFGEEYDRSYITQFDINSARWLAQYQTNDASVYADELAGLRLTSFGHITDYKYDILPSTIDVPSYVYLSKTNVQEGKVYKRYGIDFLAYTTPIKFLEGNKNLVYNNGGSEVFK